MSSASRIAFSDGRSDVPTTTWWRAASRAVSTCSVNRVGVSTTTWSYSPSSATSSSATKVGENSSPGFACASAQSRPGTYGVTSGDTGSIPSAPARPPVSRLRSTRHTCAPVAASTEARLIAIVVLPQPPVEPRTTVICPGR
ncbi:hypothetical protein [Kutzneria kofuensis]|uniref:hypothetical protein n=1 Tax=Kutzneria kofuensis TaxID=103725 RepID=UPI0031EA4FD7